MHQTFSISEKYKLLLKIILPILITQIAMYLISFFDIIMSSKYGTADLAGVSIGTSIWLPINTGLTGILLSITPIVAQLVGAKKRYDVKKAVQQGLYVAVLLAVIIFVALFLSIDPILEKMNLATDVSRIAKGYILSISFGIVPLFLYTVIRCYIEALGKTRVTMIITLLTAPINVLMNYIFIYGNFGVPALGGIGAGIGSAITYWIIFIIAIYIATNRLPFSDFELFKDWQKIDLDKWKEILMIGAPIGFAIFTESSIFSVVTMLMSNYSTEIIGAHQIAMNFASFLYMIPLSISMGATILIGFEVGAKRFHDAKVYNHLCVGTAVGFSSISVMILLLFPEQIASIYTTDSNVLHYTVQFFVFAAIFQFSDAVQAPVQGALRGYKDVKMTFIMALISYWVIGLPVGYLIAQYTSFGPFGYWLGLVAGLTTSAVTLSIRLSIIQRKNIKSDSIQLS